MAFNGETEKVLSVWNSEDQLQDTNETTSVPVPSYDNLRRTERICVPTDRMKEYKAQEAETKVKKFDNAYKAFKGTLVSVKTHVLKELSEDDVVQLKIEVEESFNVLANLYEELKAFAQFLIDFSNHQRRIDSAAACKADMITYLSHRMCEIDAREFDMEREVSNLRGLKKSYAASVYSCVTRSNCSQKSESKSIMNEATQAAAELAASQVRLEALKVQEKERTRLTELELEQKQKNLQFEREMEQQRMKLEKLQAEQEVHELSAKCKVLETAAKEQNIVPVSDDSEDENAKLNLNPSAKSFTPYFPQQCTVPVPRTDQKVPAITESSLAVALANAMDRSRLPVPTPSVFSGNPMEFVSFKRSFKTLIEDKGITAEEKIYHLQQYVTGAARNAIEGCFYCTTQEDYDKAWNTLENRYGHPFKIQEAYREKLEKWPRIGSKDCVALQKYADFLRTCLDAMPHTKGFKCVK